MSPVPTRITLILGPKGNRLFVDINPLALENGGMTHEI